MSAPDPFVDWFRQCTPYIHAHRGRTFVIAFGGEALADARLPDLVHDIALLHGLGIRVVLVHGARPQIEERLAARGAQLRYVNGLRITDGQALACVKDAAGSARVELEALLSMGLANSPMAGVRIPVASGNFVTARPLGILDGVDYQHTGAVRRIDQTALRARLADGAVVVIPPLGYSPTGEVFNLSAADVARAAAVAVEADKLIFLLEGPGLRDGAGAPVSNLVAAEVPAALAADPVASAELAVTLGAAAEACRGGVGRVHLIRRGDDGALLRELFTREGAGTLVTDAPFETLRAANLSDIAGIRELLAPLEQAGVLVPRPREHLETIVEHFVVMARDGLVLACAALFPYPEDRIGELACVAVHPAWRTHGRGERLLAHLEALARRRGLDRLFVLTTQTAHWFRERGFLPAQIDDLPVERRRLYNIARNSQVYIKPLADGR